MITWTVLFVVATVIALTAGSAAHRRELQAAEEARLTAPLAPPRLQLTPEVELVPIGARPSPWRADSHVTPVPEAVRRQTDEYGCAVPCKARHCAHHAGVTGTVAQRRHSRAAEQWNVIAALTTPTAEWDVTRIGFEPATMERFMALPKRVPGAQLGEVDDSTNECELTDATLHQLVAGLRTAWIEEEAA